MFVLPLLLSSQAAALVTGGARAPAGSGLTRRQALGAAAVLPFAPAACQADAPPASTKSGVGITVIKTGTGGTPTKGDLCAIRFKGSVKATGQVFDDIMASAEPYYFRVGKCAWPLRACVCVCVCVCVCFACVVGGAGCARLTGWVPGLPSPWGLRVMAHGLHSWIAHHRAQ